MTKQLRHDIVTPNLETFTQEITKYINDGYVMAEGFPHNRMWNYIAVLTKDVEDEVEAAEEKPVVEVKKAVGRPKTAA